MTRLVDRAPMIEYMNKPRVYDLKASKIIFKVLRSAPRRMYHSGLFFDKEDFDIPKEVEKFSSDSESE